MSYSSVSGVASSPGFSLRFGLMPRLPRAGCHVRMSLPSSRFLHGGGFAEMHMKQRAIQSILWTSGTCRVRIYIAEPTIFCCYHVTFPNKPVGLLESAWARGNQRELTDICCTKPPITTHEHSTTASSHGLSYSTVTRLPSALEANEHVTNI